MSVGNQVLGNKKKIETINTLNTTPPPRSVIGTVTSSRATTLSYFVLLFSFDKKCPTLFAISMAHYPLIIRQASQNKQYALPQHFLEKLCARTKKQHKPPKNTQTFFKIKKKVKQNEFVYFLACVFFPEFSAKCSRELR